MTGQSWKNVDQWLWFKIVPMLANSNTTAWLTKPKTHFLKCVSHLTSYCWVSSLRVGKQHSCTWVVFFLNQSVKLIRVETEKISTWWISYVEFSSTNYWHWFKSKLIQIILNFVSPLELKRHHTSFCANSMKWQFSRNFSEFSCKVWTLQKLRFLKS